MQTSMSRKGNCFDNALIESFWGSLKNEQVHHHRFKTRAEAKAAIQEYIEIFYNRQRRHSRLGNVSPAEFNKSIGELLRLLDPGLSDLVRTPQQHVEEGFEIDTERSAH